jgi:hypothetical protein
MQETISTGCSKCGAVVIIAAHADKHVTLANSIKRTVIALYMHGEVIIMDVARPEKRERLAGRYD